jgi:hypothetical protein
MAVIEAEGLFNGERFDLVSDSSRYAWPYLWVASNRFGRLELNYHRVIGRAFGRFKHVPIEEEFWSWIREFQAAYLLFVYEVNGSRWGQWDTSEKFLPKHKLASDLASPGPDHGAFSAWREEYIKFKRGQNSAKPIAVNHFNNRSENFPKDLGKSSETFVHGNGNGNGKNICASDDARLSSPSEGPNQPLDENLPFDTLDDFHTHEAKTTKPCSAGGRTNGTAHRATLEAVASSIHARHPSAHGRRDCSVAAVEKQLSAILKHKHISPGEREDYLRRVEASHAAWCASEQWQKDGGAFVKALGNWLAPTKERYDIEPAANESGDVPGRLMA